MINFKPDRVSEKHRKTKKGPMNGQGSWLPYNYIYVT